jgi:type I restriction enzyme S subunit
MPGGAILFSSRAPIGYIAIANNDITTNQGFKSIVPHIFKMSEFIYYYLMTITPEIEKMGSGTTFKEVSVLL